MAVELLWTPRAEDDLLEIYRYLALRSPAAADRLLGKLQAELEILSHHPRLCQRRPEIRSSMRILTQWPYLVLYETHPDTDDGPIESVESQDHRRPARSPDFVLISPGAIPRHPAILLIPHHRSPPPRE